MFYTAGWRRRFRLNQLTTHENYVASDIGDKFLDKATTLEDFASINSSSSDMKSADLSNIYFMAETADNLKLTSKDFAYPDSPRTDSLSLWSDATGEPLVDDSKSDVIPMSVRPLEGNFLRKMNSNRSNSFDMGSITEELPSDFEESTTQRPETPETETGDYGLKEYVVYEQCIYFNKAKLMSIVLVIGEGSNHLNQMLAHQEKSHQGMKVCLSL
jgi:hypothetical protein